MASLLVVSVILLGTFLSPETPNNTYRNRGISLSGLVVLYCALYITSANRKMIQWRTILTGLLFQYLISLFVLRTEVGYDVFSFVSSLARYDLQQIEKLIEKRVIGLREFWNCIFDLFHRARIWFVRFKTLLMKGWFLILVVPAITFFIALMQLLSYWGILPWIVIRFARIFRWAMNVSGVEAVVAVASPFVGQGENAALIKPFIPYLTRAECHQVMCSGFATISGSVLIAYISLGVNPQALLSSSYPQSLGLLTIASCRFRPRLLCPK